MQPGRAASVRPASQGDQGPVKGGFVMPIVRRTVQLNMTGLPAISRLERDLMPPACLRFQLSVSRRQLWPPHSVDVVEYLAQGSEKRTRPDHRRRVSSTELFVHEFEKRSFSAVSFRRQLER